MTSWNLPPIQAVDYFTEEEMQTAASWLRPGKAPGPDGIYVELVKISATHPRVKELMNKLISEATFPKEWKVAK